MTDRIIGTPGNETAFVKNLEKEVRGERQFKNTHVEVFQSGPPALIEVRWEFEPSVIPLSRYKIDILRGESPQDWCKRQKNKRITKIDRI